MEVFFMSLPVCTLSSVWTWGDIELWILKRGGCGRTSVNSARKGESRSDAEVKSNCAALLPCHCWRSGHPSAAAPPKHLWLTSHRLSFYFLPHARTHRLTSTELRHTVCHTTCMTIHYLHSIPALYFSHSSTHSLSSSITSIYQMAPISLTPSPHKLHFFTHFMQSQLRYGSRYI